MTNKHVMMLLFGAFILLGFMSTLSPTESCFAQQGDITGTYSCVGENAQGNQYKGTVRITKEGGAYKLAWTIGGKTHFGLALREGDTLSSCWLVGNSAGVSSGGIVVYKIKGTKLVGRWSEIGTQGLVLTETLTKQ